MHPAKRPILSLPGRPRLVLQRAPIRAPEPPAQPLRQPEAVPTATAPLWPPSTRLSAAFLARKLADLAAILGTTPDALPPILRGRTPAPLRIGIRDDLLARYPAADAVALGRWLGPWTGTEQYLRRLAEGGCRFDLDGCTAGEIIPEAMEAARVQLAKKVEKDSR